MEELKLLIPLIAQLGEASKEAFIWWLLIDKCLPILLGLIAIIAIYKSIIHLLNLCSIESEIRQLAQHIGAYPSTYNDTSKSFTYINQWIKDRK